MNTTSLPQLVEEELELARQAPSSRSARTIHGGHTRALRETVIALLGGHELAEHDSPGEATLQVLWGHVRLTSGGQVCEAVLGDHLVIPAARHALTAVEDSVVLLTVVKSVP